MRNPELQNSEVKDKRDDKDEWAVQGAIGRNLMMTIAASLLAVGAFVTQVGSAGTPTTQSPQNEAAARATREVATDGDNSAINQRDRVSSAVTADKQALNEKDVEITRQIRQALTANENLSVYAHNLKIITIDGAVTLKGPVRSSAEMKFAETAARSTAGVASVTNAMSIVK